MMLLERWTNDSFVEGQQARIHAGFCVISPQLPLCET